MNEGNYTIEIPTFEANFVFHPSDDHYIVVIGDNITIKPLWSLANCLIK